MIATNTPADVLGKPNDPLRPSLNTAATHPALSPGITAWAAGSALVHDDGSPRIFFHGTRTEFDEFRPSPSGLFGAGIYLTSSFEDAREYCDHDAQIMRVVVRMERPFHARADYGPGEAIDIDTPAIGFIRELFGEDAEQMIDRLAGHCEGHLHNEVAQQLRRLGHDGALIRWGDGLEHLLVLDPANIRVLKTAEPLPLRSRLRRP